MKAVEFITKVKDNQIQIPETIRPVFHTNPDRDVRVIILIEESEIYESRLFQKGVQEQFVLDYADADSIYDKY